MKKANLFDDLHGGEPVKNLTKEKVKHGFRYYCGEGIVMTLCKRKVSADHATPQKENITCELCKKKFKLNRTL